VAGYDIIGDIHGHAEKLVGLLKILGYRETNGAWRHPDRSAIFVGDLIDRGPQQVATVDIVRRMVESGAGHCIMGNHEFNAIAWATPDPDSPGEYLRRHGKPNNYNQHKAFLAEIENTPLHGELISWFRTLPLWLDFGDLRVIHACWNDGCLAQLETALGPEALLTDEVLVVANRKGHWAYRAVETLCKGLEIDLPDGASFHDKDGHSRHSARIKWWNKDFSSLRNSAIAPKSVLDDMPGISLDRGDAPNPYAGPPVFFGHYWLKGPQQVMSENCACVDYSAGAGGPLVAYRWNGESRLRNEGFVAFPGD
jgi:Calcineurin-like phosphoesterase